MQRATPLGSEPSFIDELGRSTFFCDSLEQKLVELPAFASSTQKVFADLPLSNLNYEQKMNGL